MGICLLETEGQLCGWGSWYVVHCLFPAPRTGPGTQHTLIYYVSKSVPTQYILISFTQEIFVDQGLIQGFHGDAGCSRVTTLL